MLKKKYRLDYYTSISGSNNPKKVYSKRYRSTFYHKRCYICELKGCLTDCVHGFGGFRYDKNSQFIYIPNNVIEEIKNS